MSADERLERARQLYERAVFGGDATAVGIAERELTAVEADLALARGRLLHARFLQGSGADPHELTLFQRAAQLYQELGDVRGEADALFWIGVCHQVVRQDGEAAVPFLERSRDLASQAGDELTLSYALRHLGIAERAAGRLDAARQLLEESARLRRGLGFLPGVAANLVGLAYLAAAEGRHRDALALAREARDIAAASDAQTILRQAEEARAHINALP